MLPFVSYSLRTHLPLSFHVSPSQDFGHLTSQSLSCGLHLPSPVAGLKFGCAGSNIQISLPGPQLPSVPSIEAPFNEHPCCFIHCVPSQSLDSIGTISSENLNSPLSTACFVASSNKTCILSVSLDLVLALANPSPTKIIRINTTLVVPSIYIE